jgi:splicing factor 3A subunit 1
MQMDEDVEMEEDDEDQQGKREESLELELDAEPAVVEIKPPDATAPIKIRKDYVPKGIFRRI